MDTALLEILALTCNDGNSLVHLARERLLAGVRLIHFIHTTRDINRVKPRQHLPLMREAVRADSSGDVYLLSSQHAGPAGRQLGMLLLSHHSMIEHQNKS